MAEQNDQIKTITIDNVAYDLSTFSDEAQRLVQIRQVWFQESAKAELEFARASAAVRDIDREIIQKLKTELDANAEKLAEPITEGEVIEVPVE